MIQVSKYLKFGPKFSVSSQLKTSNHLNEFFGEFLPQFFLNNQITLHLMSWHALSRHYMPLITMVALVVVDHHKDTNEGKEEKMEEVNEGIISTKGKLSILKIGRRNYHKTPLNGQLSLIEDLLKNIGPILKSVKACTLF